MSIHSHYHTILLAEDDGDDYDFFYDAIKQLGEISLTRVNDGETLMSMLSSRLILPDIIYLDINMPRKDGITCLKEIRNSSALKNIPVIIMSTTQNESIIDELFQAGANLYICKPNTFGELKDAILKTLSIDWDKQLTISSKENFLYTF